MQNFRALGALPPDPRASGGWGYCPQNPRPPNSPPLRISGYAPDSNKKCCNFEIVLITGKQKDFLKITFNLRRSLIGWQLVSSHLALNKKSKK